MFPVILTLALPGYTGLYRKTIILLITDDIKRGIKGLYWLRKKGHGQKS